MGKLLEMYGIEASVDTSTTETPSFASLDDGFDNLAESLNEVVQNYSFLKDKGFGSAEVTGMAPTVTITGRRVIGDAAQDFIFSKKYKTGADRKVPFKIEWAEGSATKTLTVTVTMTKIQEWSGATTDNSAISVELAFNGAPIVA